MLVLPFSPYFLSSVPSSRHQSLRLPASGKVIGNKHGNECKALLPSLSISSCLGMDEGTSVVTTVTPPLQHTQTIIYFTHTYFNYRGVRDGGSNWIGMVFLGIKAPMHRFYAALPSVGKGTWAFCVLQSSKFNHFVPE